MKGKVDILDLVDIVCYRVPPRNPVDRAPIGIDIVPHDKTKQVVWDQDSLKNFNNILTEKSKSLKFNNPNSLDYLKQYVGMMLSELYRNGLVDFEELSDAPEDHYAHLRKNFRN